MEGKHAKMLFKWRPSKRKKLMIFWNSCEEKIARPLSNYGAYLSTGVAVFCGNSCGEKIARPSLSNYGAYLSTGVAMFCGKNCTLISGDINILKSWILLALFECCYVVCLEGQNMSRSCCENRIGHCHPMSRKTE
ncbi:hypothetical protein CEXT_535641 [Caerostris extrusa]|uniref:Uncharacterized protein n=1 Tax=Caerostris extrusa TaxID=172846 RepID=A0AAV4XBC6_CAEEX|nr:hypothetical protein CEXT_535641 [Caerostris extrusa]